MMPGNHEFYEHSLKLWENLSHELNYNVMFSQRAHVSLFHSPGAKDSVSRIYNCLLYTSPSPRDALTSRMPSSA